MRSERHDDSGSISEPWGAQCIFQRGEAAFKLWWASNPGAMTHLFTCWVERQRSSSPRMQLLVLGITDSAFRYLDWGALGVKRMLAAEVMRLEAESDDQDVQMAAYEVSRRFPEIQAMQWAMKSAPRTSASLCQPIPWPICDVFFATSWCWTLGAVF